MMHSAFEKYIRVRAFVSVSPPARDDYYVVRFSWRHAQAVFWFKRCLVAVLGQRGIVCVW